MSELRRGDKVIVETLKGEVRGQVVSVRMAPPNYEKPMAVSVIIPSRPNVVIYPANKVRKCS